MTNHSSISKISVIIPTYNRSKYIYKTLESFVNQNYPKNLYEIIIADNNSTDDTRSVVEEFIKSVQQPHCLYLYEERQGVHFARNTAAKNAQNELLYFTDDDMIADVNLLTEIIKPFQYDEMVADVTGRVLPIWEVTPPNWVLKHCFNSLLSLLDPPDEFLITTDIKYLYSCHQAISRGVFFQCEGFNPEYTKRVYLGDGETGLNIKVKNLGYKFGYNGKSITYHIIPPHRMTQKYLNNRIGNNGNAHSYTEYRSEAPSNLRLLQKAAKRSFIVAPARLSLFLIKAILNFDFAYVRFFWAYCFYYLNRLFYELKIVFNPAWRKFVLKNDWLSESENVALKKNLELTE